MNRCLSLASPNYIRHPISSLCRGGRRGTSRAGGGRAGGGLGSPVPAAHLYLRYPGLSVQDRLAQAGAGSRGAGCLAPLRDAGWRSSRIIRPEGEKRQEWQCGQAVYCPLVAKGGAREWKAGRRSAAKRKGVEATRRERRRRAGGCSYVLPPCTASDRSGASRNGRSEVRSARGVLAYATLCFSGAFASPVPPEPGTDG
jgi:hypothetical protein